MSTCEGPGRSGSRALPSSLSPMDDGKPISKQWLYKWLIECAKCTYGNHDLPILAEVKGHQTCKMAVTYADMAGVYPQTICSAAT